VLNKRLEFKSDTIVQPEISNGCVSSNDVLVTQNRDQFTIKQFNTDNTYTQANINLSDATGSIKIHTPEKDYECVKIIIENTETDIDANLLKILLHDNYKIDNSFMFTIINKQDVAFEPSNSATYSIIYSFDNFINTNFERYEYFRITSTLPEITQQQLIAYDNMVKKIIDNMIKIKIKMINEISREVKPNDVFFYKMRADKVGNQRDSSPASNIHMDSCNTSRDGIEYTNNHNCEVTGIYYLNIINDQKNNYNSSAIFFYGPEIPSPLSMQQSEFIDMNLPDEAIIGNAFFNCYKRIGYSVPIKSNSYAVWYNKPLKYKKFNKKEYKENNSFYGLVNSYNKFKPNRIGTEDSKNYMMHLSPISLQDAEKNKIQSEYLNGNRSFINPRLSNMNIYSTIRYIFNFDSSKNETINAQIRENNLYSLCYIVIFYLSFEDFNAGEIGYNKLCEDCSKLIKNILVKSFNINLDEIVINSLSEWGVTKEGKYYSADMSYVEGAVMNAILEIIKSKSIDIKKQAIDYEKLIKIRYEEYFNKPVKNTEPFKELHEYLSSILSIVKLQPKIRPHEFSTEFLTHTSSKDEQYYKKYLKYKLKYTNLKKKLNIV